MNKFKVWLFKMIFDCLPVSPTKALWKIIDEENQKPEDEIRCDYIEAWLEAIERVQNFENNDLA